MVVRASLDASLYFDRYHGMAHFGVASESYLANSNAIVVGTTCTEFFMVAVVLWLASHGRSARRHRASIDNHPIFDRCHMVQRPDRSPTNTSLCAMGGIRGRSEWFDRRVELI